MSNYVKSTNFATKDNLSSGDPLKIVKGTEINTEYDNIATAVATKADLASPTFTGTVVIPTLSVTGTSALTGVATLTAQPILSSLTASKPVFTDASKGLVSTGTLSADQGGTGVANNVAMTVTGSGNFAYTRTLTAATNVTLPTTGTLATLAGSETFTNKTLTSPVIGGTPTGVGVLTSGTTAATTSGTSIDFTGIPTWVKRITVMLQGVSQDSATQTFMFQIGAASFTTTGYLSVVSFIAPSTATASVTTGFGFAGPSGAAAEFSGIATITLLGSNLYTFSSNVADVANTQAHFGAGSITLGGALDRVRLTTVGGTATFDAGSINILYE
jgi:hypothetical protein